MTSSLPDPGESMPWHPPLNEGLAVSSEEITAVALMALQAQAYEQAHVKNATLTLGSGAPARQWDFPAGPNYVTCLLEDTDSMRRYPHMRVLAGYGLGATFSEGPLFPSGSQMFRIEDYNFQNRTSLGRKPLYKVTVSPPSYGVGDGILGPYYPKRREIPRPERHWLGPWDRHKFNAIVADLQPRKFTRVHLEKLRDTLKIAFAEVRSNSDQFRDDN